MERTARLNQRDKVKAFTLRELTDDFSLYHPWRQAFNAKLLTVGISRELAGRFVKTISESTEAELKRRTIDPGSTESELEGFVYSAVKDCLKSKGVIRHSLTIDQDGQYGLGSNAIKILDRLFKYTGDRRASEANKSMRARTCTNMDQLATFMAETRTDLTVLVLNGEPKGEVSLYDYLEEKLAPNTDKGVSATNATFAEWSARKRRGQNTDQRTQA